VPDTKINLEDKFGSSRLIDVGAKAAAVAAASAARPLAGSRG
jgi:hypothetical protein